MSSQFEPSTRRLSNSCLIRHFYCSVNVINSQRQAANAIRICKYMQRNHGIKPADCIAELELCVRDGLLHFERTVGTKGSKKGALQERYVIPAEPKRYGHDWYCFECHKGGEVIGCSSCHRVFHSYCIHGVSPEIFSCYVCRGQDKSISFTKEKLNRLLGYLCKSIKDLVPNKLKKWKNWKLNELLMNALLYKPMDLHTIQKKIQDLQYNHWLEFAADSKNILHNTIIYFGERNSLTQQMSKMIEYCLHDLREIEICADCYEASNDRTDKLWFCKPCKPLHRLVFAKLETFPFWPAKVITQFDDKYDVRFFGSRHTRSVVPKAHVIPITPSIKHIENLPKYGHTSSWEKAMSELIFHIICIGPQIILKCLPTNYNEKNILTVASPNSHRMAKRKTCDDDPRSKKMRCHEDTGGNKSPNMYKMCDILVRKIIKCDNRRCNDNFVNKNNNCDETNSEQQVIASDIPNLQSHTNTTKEQPEMQEVVVQENIDSTNIGSPSVVDSDTVSLSELHEEIDIKDECVEENEYQIDDQIKFDNTTGTNVECDKTNSEQEVEGISSLHTIPDSTGQQTESHKKDVPKKSDSVTLAHQSELRSNSVPLQLFSDQIATKNKHIDRSKYQISYSNKIGDGVQAFQNIQNHCNSTEKYSFTSESDADSLQVLAESIVVKEEPLCLQCSGLDLITKKEAEKMRDEAVAQTKKKFLAIIARMQEQCGQSTAVKKIPVHNVI